MTAGEQASLNTLSEYIREWRTEDAKWKDDVAARLKKLEDDKIARDAVVRDRQQARSNNMWRTVAIGGFLSATGAGVAVATLKMVFNI